MYTSKVVKAVAFTERFVKVFEVLKISVLNTGDTFEKQKEIHKLLGIILKNECILNVVVVMQMQSMVAVLPPG